MVLPAAAQKDTNTLVWGMVTKPRHLNSAVQSGTATGLPAGQLFASPLLANDKWEMEPYLAESFKFEDNNRSLVLKVRKGATFHDGKPITSADFAFSIMAVKAHHPFQGMMSAVEKVDTPDPDTASIRLSQPHPVILLALTSPFCPILPKHIFDTGTDLKTHPRNMDPIGSGPFKLVEFKPGQHVIMERNKDFFVKGAPRLDRVIIRFFSDTNAMGLAIEAKEVHYAAFIPDISVVEKLSTVPGITVNSKGGEGVGPLNWLAFNTARAPFNDPKVRQALSFAIDREFITKRLHRGRSVAATGPITPTSPYATADVEPYKVDLAKAERLLDEAGLKKGADGIRLKTTITYQPGNRDLTQNVVEYIKAQFRRIGVDLAITPAADFPS